MPERGTIENTPLVVEGIMYVARPTNAGRSTPAPAASVWHYQRTAHARIAGNAAGGFNRGVAWSPAIACSCSPTTPT